MPAGKELKRIREASNMSAAKLAKTIGIKGDRLRKWEQMDLNPRHDDAALIEKFFKVPVSDLFKIKKVPVFQKLHNVLEEDSETRYNTKDDLIKSMQETIESQKKIIAFLEYQLKQYMPKEGKDLFEIDEPVTVKKTTAKT